MLKESAPILITGANGQLGRALKEKYPGAKVTTRKDLDIADRTSVEAFDWSGIEVVINAAAYTNVDGAETPEGRIQAWGTNAIGVANLVGMIAASDITLVSISTDYVFDGTNDIHTEDEPLSPLSNYGASKAAGDLVVGLTSKTYTIRPSWVIGDGKNFVKTMLKLGQEGVSPKVVGDQIGRLTFIDDLVAAIDHLVSVKAPYGTYNLSGNGDPISWAGVAEEVFKIAGINQEVTSITTEEYMSDKQVVAARPLKSTLSLDKIMSAGFEPTCWRTALKNYIEGETQK